ncbi:protein UPSTREAM OF FLC-like [Durio zibethinus]|uniref:Protein UPSTREAM OF FLC-like n=1 Tax=Durio zibethinus TaxID=66656 RepID=A0A6P5YJP7_DURZI|nr:protein UPSTREAM OF FLC-like [Durio zibethinus]
MDVRTRRARESSPDRAKVCMQPKVLKPIRKVRVVYYLTRNGQLEHPHYMEVTHLVNQPLRLRDVMERLTALRGKGMPSLYSWSCKRNYKNGYVWNDLADNDIIPPSDGAEYVLKGSELVEGCSERSQQLQISNRVPYFQEPSLQAKQKSPTFTLTRHRGAQEVERRACEEQEFDEEEEEEEEEEYELDEEKTSYTSSTTPHSRCSKGVSTDELEDQETSNQEPQKTISQPAQQDASLLSQSSILFEKQNESKISISKRFEDGDPVATGSAPSRNSVLRQLIACGNLAVNKTKNVPTMKQPVVTNNVVKKSENLHRVVLSKSAVKVAEDDQMINFMSENPRFGNLQAEEKEYFSGSIVESMNSENRIVAEPVLKKSNSYNEERSCKAGLSETVEEEKKDKSVKGKCIPRKKSSKQNQKMRAD